MNKYSPFTDTPLSDGQRSLVLSLNAANQNFYATVAKSFSSTRQTAWKGWDTCIDVFQSSISESEQASRISVLDIACGNLRFEEYLLSKTPNQTMSFIACDNCLELIELSNIDTSTIRFVNQDIVVALLDDIPLIPTDISVSLSVCFGFFHHVPSFELRLRLLSQLLDALKPGGICCISLWRFMRDKRLNLKAQETTDRALGVLDIDSRLLEQGDYFLGWQNHENIYRYCHYFCDEELAALIGFFAGKAECIMKFDTEGKANNLNTYLIFKKL